MYPKFIDEVVNLDNVEPDIRETIITVGDKTGFVPAVFTKLALRPDEFRAFFAYHNALMSKEGGLSKKEREMIVVVTSAQNNCLYCVVAHGAILRIYSKDSTISDQIATNYRLAELSERERVICDFAVRVAVSADSIDEEDYDACYSVGLTDDEIWDIGAISAMFAMSNRIAGFTQLRPNREFYTMGRKY
ncbi:MAG: peroxidase-related enzyme [Actinomycetota bacterium]|nr:peroxidase-related enzyme [Actinomycetota bacterium]